MVLWTGNRREQDGPSRSHTGGWGAESSALPAGLEKQVDHSFHHHPFCRNEEYIFYCFRQVRKSVRGAFNEKVGDVAECFGAQLDARCSIPVAPSVLGATLRGTCPPAPSRLTLLFAFCLDVEWTEWFDHDKVSHTKGGEKISDLRVTHPGKICNRPIDIQVPNSKQSESYKDFILKWGL